MLSIFGVSRTVAGSTHPPLKAAPWIHHLKEDPHPSRFQQLIIQMAMIGKTFRITIIRGNSCQLKNLQGHAFCGTYFAER
jgi:hypothetical protein